MGVKSSSTRHLRPSRVTRAAPRADRRAALPGLSADLRGLSADAASRLDRIDRTVADLSTTARDLAQRLAYLEGRLCALRAESARSGASRGADSDAAALADSLSGLIEKLRAAIVQIDRARAAVTGRLAQSTHAAAAVGARAALLARGFESGPDSTAVRRSGRDDDRRGAGQENVPDVRPAAIRAFRE